MCIYLNLMILIKIIRGFISYEQYHPQAGPQALYRYQDEEKRYTWQKANKRDCFGVDRSGK
ncbi:hypothetical protein AE576_05205 [Salmonella enterica subsp. enterica serovar Kentucky]|nr:hypothetical protein [Salmonella enterica subsp. enterica serovar Kentucky]